MEAWFSAPHQVFTARHGPEIYWLDPQQQTIDVYDATENTIVRVPLDRDDQRQFALASELFGALMAGDARGALEAGPGKFVLEEEKTVDEGASRWIELRFARQDPNRPGLRQAMILRVDSATRLPVWWKMVSHDSDSGSDYSWEMDIDYPADGPRSLHAMGVPETAQFIDRVPRGDLARLLNGMKTARQRFDSYHAIVLETLPSKHWSREGVVYRVWRDGNRWRMEQGFGVGDRLRDEALPEADADPYAWWMQRFDRLRFVPEEVCDGESIWIYTVHRRSPTQEEFDAGAPQELIITSIERRCWGPIKKDDPRPYNVRLTPKFLGSGGRLPLSSWSYQAEVDPDPQTGPPGTVLLELRNRKKTGDRDYRAWIDPAKGYLVMRTEMLGVNIGNKTGVQASVIDEVGRSPLGHWYPKVFRTEKNVHLSSRDEWGDSLTVFYVDFDAPMSDGLFDPAKRADGRPFDTVPE